MYEHGSYVYTFGAYCLNPDEHLLLRDGVALRLTPKAFEVLLVLVESGGRLVGKDELIKRLWPDTFVEEGSLSVHISTLRKTMGEGRCGEKYIETISGRGYRFVAETRRLEREGKKNSYMLSIAVLPFKVMGVSPGDDYLGTGIADVLITKLSQISHLVVRPTSAILKYAASALDPCSAGRELYVDTILDGRIQRAGEQIRVTVQLLDVRDGSLLWAEKFDQDLTNIFTFEDSISERVAQTLQLPTTPTQTSRLTKPYTRNIDAYQFYLRGRYHWNKRNSGSFARAIDYFEKAVAVDPDFALAHAGLADTYILLNSLPAGEVMPKAKAAATKALELDNALAEAHSSLAFVLENYEWDWEGAEKEYRQAIELKPNYATARQWYAEHLAAMGRHDEALAEINRAHMLDPLSLSISNSVARQFYFARDYARAIEQCRHTLEMAPDFLPALYRLGGIYVQSGMHDEAIATFKRAVELSGRALVMVAELGYAYAMAGQIDNAQQIIDEIEKLSENCYIEPGYLAQINLGLGRKEQAFEGLEKAVAERLPLIIYLRVDPIFDSLRSDPRFKKLLRLTVPLTRA